MKIKFTEIIEFTDKPCDKFEGKCKYVSTGSLHGNTIIDDETVMVSYDSRPSRANLKVKSEDIIFAKMQYTHKTLLIDENLSNNIYSTGFFAVSPKKDIINKKCLFYLINNKIFLNQKDRNCSGATQKAINKQGLSLIELNIPALKEQEEICRILDIIEDIIRIRQMQIKRLDDLVKARFVEMFGDANQTLISIGAAVKLINGKAFKPSDWSQSGVPIIRIQNLNNADAPYNYFSGNYDLKYYIKKGDLLFSWSGTPGTSFGAFIWDKEPGVLNQHIFKVIPKESLNRFYLKYALNSRINQMITKAHGGVGLQHITKQELESIQIPIPNEEHQEKFADFVAQVDKSKFVYRFIFYYYYNTIMRYEKNRQK